MERHFACTACGKCCFGILPLTLDEALAQADTFPLALAWTPVRQGGRSFDLTADLGATVKLKNRKTAAVQISPISDLPPSFSCPHLTSDGRCAVHTNKPQRCKAMPFNATRTEDDQDDLLLPRPGWTCDVSDTAPVVYRDKRLVERQDFDAERESLLRDARILKPYAAWLMDSVPSLRMEVQRVAMKPSGGRVLVSFATLIPRLPKVDIYAFAARQAPVMRAYAEKTAADPGLAEFHKRYAQGAAEWEKVAL
ncbi:MAG: hypothetical protein A2516_07935 [Alphaproteobacteria bacterium RIFOXYD12_FULL_60_8]|nr:MAG: hypothetical protein A2516_07935 [Alphaproteobacteria bacterium RIFOXYD12_FULL_60_8]